MSLAARWRVLRSGAQDGATNMATDVALLHRAARTGEAVLRLYAWSRPTISFGMHERVRYTPDEVARLGADAVRRPTGGRALLHHHELTYSVTAPVGETTLAQSYQAINVLLLDALHELGVDAVPAPRRGRARAPDGAACFAEPNVGELVVGSRKLVGSAQRRDAGALLQHGSILLENDQGLLGATTATSLREVLGRAIGRDEVARALVTALDRRESYTGELDAGSLTAEVAKERALFADPAWTYRR